MGMMPNENRGMGLEQPVEQPGPVGAADEQFQPPPQPELQPLMPAVPGMEGLGASTPGGGDESTDELMQLIMSLRGPR